MPENVRTFRMVEAEWAAFRAKAKAAGVTPSSAIRELVQGCLSGQSPDPARLKAANAREAETVRITQPIVDALGGRGDPLSKPSADPVMENLRRQALAAGVRPEGMLCFVLQGGEVGPAPSFADRLAVSLAEQGVTLTPYGESAKSARTVAGLTDAEFDRLVAETVRDMRAREARKATAKPAKVPAGDEPFVSPRLERIRLEAALEKPPIPAAGLLAALANGGLSPTTEITAKNPLTVDEMNELVDRWQASQ
jgi:hypothetical protein